MSKTNIFCDKMTTPDDEYTRGMAKVAQTPTECRDAPPPGMRRNPALSVQNIHKSAPATGRRP